ncbi:bifunctional 3-(3-hydroxy-phenyl)propionate/3-hydroxycinnamic acid hydroxylase [Actinocrinis sp.]|uniref:bifunctional 3-(3-hydroxy-phenyl)propionate/3-hydroxycinnamic acid hydroxylase n=1 Tax=Actinocrinis sp. TaxID=1920516 RepID=UPI002D26C61E|nr:bifunctional 3-(3-hydroxy-phenyl)propionate/3-hydroxycinnamic acid hydroxylase [Actinocrinis sp.]HZP52498.1 bifunctional 3-(3-hydroxy-phenyl)propionate/3-hydroxycinnamic acid hydroxylase [Actinocrinis sp.]
MTTTQHVSVAVVGAGPVGATAANLLGVYGVSTLIVDRERDIVEYPRAIGVDDESLRTFQSGGLADEIVRTAIQNVPLKFFDAAGRCLADIRPSARDYGWHKRNIFMQPKAEAVLREGLRRFPHVRMDLGTQLRELKQDDDGVSLLMADESGETREVRADYVIAADGGRSSIRSQLGIPLEGSTHPRKWVVIDCAKDPLDAPYTALRCDPRRPYVSAHLPDDHRRWEFMLFPGEDADELLAPESVKGLLQRHAGAPAAADVLRARVYTHHSRIAARFVAGRVALAGDAAHLMPPWAGQGMNTGIRDVTNLCWKLAAIVRGQADPSLLATYDAERRPHAKAMIELSTTLGRVLAPKRLSAARLRDLTLRAASLAPAIRAWILEMRFKPVPDYRAGFVAHDGDAGDAPSVGRMLPQPMVEMPAGSHVRLDDALGPWFAVLGFECDPLARLSGDELAAVRRFQPRVVKILKSRAGTRHHAQPCVSDDTVVIEDLDNHLRPWFQAQGRNVAFVRPDRFVAAMTDLDGVGPAITGLADRLTAPRRRSDSGRPAERGGVP